LRHTAAIVGNLLAKGTLTGAYFLESAIAARLNPESKKPRIDNLEAKVKARVLVFGSTKRRVRLPFHCRH
jgi:hypothetical protein